MKAHVTISLDELIQLKAEARGFSFLPRQPVHSLLAGRHASRLRGRGLNFEELRGYVSGDDIRNVDWRATARATAIFWRVALSNPVTLCWRFERLTRRSARSGKLQQLVLRPEVQRTAANELVDLGHVDLAGSLLTPFDRAGLREEAVARQQR